MFKPFQANIIKKNVYARRRFRVVTFVFAVCGDDETIGATMLIRYDDSRTWRRINELNVGDLVQVSLRHLRSYRTPVVTKIARVDQLKRRPSQAELERLYWKAVAKDKQYRATLAKPAEPVVQSAESFDPDLPF